jgi:hypothetical protein
MMRDRNRGGGAASAARLRSLCGAFGTIAVLGTTVAKAQDAEPRTYSNTPVGLNFLVAGALYSQGKLAFDPDLSVADANFHSNTGLLAYIVASALLDGHITARIEVPWNRAIRQGPNRFDTPRSCGPVGQRDRSRLRRFACCSHLPANGIP